MPPCRSSAPCSVPMPWAVCRNRLRAGRPSCCVSAASLGQVTGIALDGDGAIERLHRQRSVPEEGTQSRKAEHDGSAQDRSTPLRVAHVSFLSGGARQWLGYPPYHSERELSASGPRGGTNDAPGAIARERRRGVPCEWARGRPISAGRPGGGRRSCGRDPAGSRPSASSRAAGERASGRTRA